MLVLHEIIDKLRILEFSPLLLPLKRLFITLGIRQPLSALGSDQITRADTAFPSKKISIKLVWDKNEIFSFDIVEVVIGLLIRGCTSIIAVEL